MGRRLKLHKILTDISAGYKVYFQPPPSFTMEYPCLVYTRQPMTFKSADNCLYNVRECYQITLIDRHPEPPLHMKLANLEYCKDSSYFVSEGLHHFVYTIYI